MLLMKSLSSNWRRSTCEDHGARNLGTLRPGSCTPMLLMKRLPINLGGLRSPPHGDHLWGSCGPQHRGPAAAREWHPHTAL